MHEDVVGRVHAGKLQHGRPEQRMEVDDVLADEMHLTVRPLRILTGLRVDEGIEVQAALLAQRLQRGQVAHRGVQPHVEILTRRIRDGNAEVGFIARDVPVGQRVAGTFALGRASVGCIAAQPFARLVGHLGLQPALRQPVVQELAAARIGEAEEIVLGAADDRRAAGQGGIGVDEVSGGVDLAADLAGVAVLVLGVAVGALALDVAVRQEHFLHRIEELLDGARGHQARRLQPPVDLLRQRRVLGRMGGVPVVEADVIAVQVVRPLGGNACHQFFGRDALGLGLQHDRCAVGIIGPHEQHVLAQHALEAHPDVGLDVLHDVADVERSVGVGQGGGDEQTLGMLAGGGRHGGGCRCGGWLGLAHENAGGGGQDARVWRTRCPVRGGPGMPGALPLILARAAALPVRWRIIAGRTASGPRPLRRGRIVASVGQPASGPGHDCHRSCVNMANVKFAGHKPCEHDAETGHPVSRAGPAASPFLRAGVSAGGNTAASGAAPLTEFLYPIPS